MKQMQVDQEDLMVMNVERLSKLIEGLSDKNVSDAIFDMLDSEFGSRYLSAPASGRVEYHNCFKGGLLDHSLNVFDNLMKLRDTFYPDIPHDDVVISALLHDLGKCGSVEEAYYEPQDSKWHQDKLGEYYKNANISNYLETAQRSLRLLGQFNVDISDEVYRAILIHDGQYVDSNKRYSHKEGSLGLLLHMADMIACTNEKNNWVEQTGGK